MADIRRWCGTAALTVTAAALLVVVVTVAPRDHAMKAHFASNWPWVIPAVALGLCLGVVIGRFLDRVRGLGETP